MGFWSVHETLFVLKNCNVKLDLFTPKVDVYNYTMTCYKILTSNMPLQDFPMTN